MECAGVSYGSHSCSSSSSSRSRAVVFIVVALIVSSLSSSSCSLPRRRRMIVVIVVITIVAIIVVVLCPRSHFGSRLRPSECHNSEARETPHTTNDVIATDVISHATAVRGLDGRPLEVDPSAFLFAYARLTLGVDEVGVGEAGARIHHLLVLSHHTFALCCDSRLFGNGGECARSRG